MPETVDVDLDALAPAPKRVKLGGKTYRLPGDMPMELYFKLQAYEQRIKDGIDETALLTEMRDELLKLLRVHHPELKELPGKIGMTQLIGALPAIYASAEGEPPANRQTRRSRKKTPSATPRTRARQAT